MRRIFGSRPTRFGRGDAVRLKTDLPNDGLKAGTVGTVFEVRRTSSPSYDVRFVSANGVVGRSVVDEADLMPADGRSYDDNDVVTLNRDVPSQGLTAGAVGVVSEVSPGPPVTYTVEFANARIALSDADLSSPDEAPEPAAETPVGQGGGGEIEELGLADEQLDELIAELRSQGRAMQQQAEAAPAAQAPAPQAPTPPEQVPQEEQQQQQPAREEPPAQAVEPPVRPAEPSVQVPPSDGRRTRFIRGEAVRLGADLPSAGFGAGAEGVVTWVILGPPVSYLVEFQSGGGSSAPTKVEEGYLSPAG